MKKKILIISSNRLGDSILSSGLNKFFKDKKIIVLLLHVVLCLSVYLSFVEILIKFFLFKKKKIFSSLVIFMDKSNI